MMWNVLIDRKGVNRIQTELLLRKAQSGDTGALDTLIAAYYPQILNYCHWHTHRDVPAIFKLEVLETEELEEKKRSHYPKYKVNTY